VVVAAIREQPEYGGVRIELIARLTTAQIRLQIDVGFGDAITPGATMEVFPALLDFPAPRLRAYPRETVVAEKLEAIVQLGMANSRMKDFFDLVELANRFDFDGPTLERAIRATFDRRKTPLPRARPVALTEAFTKDPTKIGQWSGFIRKAGVRDAGTLRQAAATIAAFVERPLQAAAGEGKQRPRGQLQARGDDVGGRRLIGSAGRVRRLSLRPILIRYASLGTQPHRTREPRLRLDELPLLPQAGADLVQAAAQARVVDASVHVALFLVPDRAHEPRLSLGELPLHRQAVAGQVQADA
jgi:hypothetical protein